jgi:hypothetical protein
MLSAFLDNAPTYLVFFELAGGDPFGGTLGSLADSQCNSGVRFGSKADICAAKSHVRFAPKSRHLQRTSPCPLCAKSGHQ